MDPNDRNVPRGGLPQGAVGPNAGNIPRPTIPQGNTLTQQEINAIRSNNSQSVK